jgi:alcohol dehydrogenase
VIRFNSPKAQHLYQQLAEVIMFDRPRSADPAELTEQLAAYFLDLAKDLGLPTTLREMTIEESGLQQLAEQSMLQQRLLINNPRTVDVKQAKAIYQSAY